jgi:hypothetical protein
MSVGITKGKCCDFPFQVTDVRRGGRGGNLYRKLCHNTSEEKIWEQQIRRELRDDKSSEGQIWTDSRRKRQ